MCLGALIILTPIINLGYLLNPTPWTGAGLRIGWAAKLLPGFLTVSERRLMFVMLRNHHLKMMIICGDVTSGTKSVILVFGDRVVNTPNVL